MFTLKNVPQYWAKRSVNSRAVFAALAQRENTVAFCLSKGDTLLWHPDELMFILLITPSTPRTEYRMRSRRQVQVYPQKRLSLHRASELVGIAARQFTQYTLTKRWERNRKYDCNGQEAYTRRLVPKI